VLWSGAEGWYKLDLEINEELLEKWEPKVQKFLQTTFVNGMDRDDIAQELRIAIVKAASHFDNSKGVVFHTYLHTVMVNTLRTLIAKAQKTKNVNITYSIDGMDVDDNPQGFLPNEIANSLSDTTALEFINNVELMDIITRSDLTTSELQFLELRLEGMTMEYISERLEDSAYKIRNTIQKKIQAFVITRDKLNEKKT
jgi:RNA polymerase sigma factor (sigma-70 family)|tara:strand:+ start:11388 stop:11981 length:594 start_codon:yes stop_codon:yes gene_type:complete